VVTRNRQRIVAPRKERNWGIANFDASISVATQAGSSVGSLSGELETTLGMSAHNWTASALNFNVWAHSVIAGAIWDRTELAIGIGWFNDDAIAAGSSSLPDPATDDADWMYHSFMEFAARDTVANARFVPYEGYQVRNRSMRKQREAHSSLVVIIRAVVLQRTTAVHFSGRTLFLLP